MKLMRNKHMSLAFETNSKFMIMMLAIVAFSSFASLQQEDFPKGAFQTVNYDVRAMYEYSIKKEKLVKAKHLSDIITSYPKNWISAYNSVEVIARIKGKEEKAISSSDVLTKEQRRILSEADLATDVVINVAYKKKDDMTHIVENKKMHVVMTVVPEFEAEYIGGQKALMGYLKENGKNKIPQSISPQQNGASVRFSIAEDGGVTNVRILQSWGDPKIDAVLLDLISKMPKWKPAEELNGKKVKQEFEFSVGRGGC